MILIQIITFGVIVVILRLLFGTQLKIALNRLQDLQQESLEKETVLNKEIERARAQSQSEIARSKEEARLILEAAHKNAERIAQEGAEQAQVQARKVLSQAAEHAKGLESAVMGTVAVKAVELARQLIVSIFSEKGLEAFHARLVEEFLEEFERIDRGRLNVSADKVEVVSGRPIEPAHRQKLTALLKAKFGREVAVEEKTDPALLVGVVVQMGGLIVDASLQNKLRKAMEAMREG